MNKKVLVAIAAGLITFSTFGGVNAATRDEIAAIRVQTASDFQYWNADSPTKQKIIEFVEDVTNPYSANYIPPEDRIATFDMDGTFYCEGAGDRKAFRIRLPSDAAAPVPERRSMRRSLSVPP